MVTTELTGVIRVTEGLELRQPLRPRILSVSPDRDGRPVGSSHLGTVRDCLMAAAGNLNFMRNLGRTIPQYDIVRLHFLSGIRSFGYVLPVIVLGRFLGKRVVLRYDHNQAEAELESSGWWMLPLFKLCDRIVVSSKYVADRLGCYGVRAEVIPTAVDARLFIPREICFVQPRIIVSRSIEKRNNIACAIEAFGLVKQKYPRAEMVIAGDGSQRGELERLVAADRLNGVTFTGRLDQHQRASCFAKADVYVNTSTIDGLPASLLEALAVGLPVITTDAGGIAAIITDRENGLIVRHNDPSMLADRIIELVESPELVTKLSEQAKASVNDYSWSQVDAKWGDLYWELYRSGGGSR